ncbi:hypothetical protein [Marivita hallyeonensis]|uniref:Uncharacterized protein n=1 Tax=Marivita hallyeonensis TaxID=996342 RepID=A0A1M5XE78_9RHOB|nr:hypothetical protein [Marivita hallyeonensis]SHH98059.1 hypothetical protein SAMN05443551_3884 [Marivita hallyeonensis]
MKVVRKTDEQLVLENTPWLLAIGLSLFILVFVGAGLARMSEDLFEGLAMMGISAVGGTLFLAIFVRRTQLILDRQTDSVRLRRRGFFGYSETRFTLSDLSRARVQVSRSSKNGAHTERVALVFTEGPDEGTHPVTLVYTNGKGPRRAETAINDWLEGSAARDA